MEKINQKIKEIFGSKGAFYKSLKIEVKNGACKLKTVENRIKWLNDFLKPLGLEINISQIDKLLKMKNTKIEYDLSKDYNRLYELLKSNHIVIGFTSIHIDGVPCMDYSKITTMHYNSEYLIFDLGFSFFESFLLKNGDFEKICKKNNVQFFDIKS